MRQAGMLAAAGIFALDHQVERLAKDHQHAKALEQALLKKDFIESVYEFYKIIQPENLNFIKKMLPEGSHSSRLEKVIDDRIQTNQNSISIKGGLRYSNRGPCRYRRKSFTGGSRSQELS